MQPIELRCLQILLSINLTLNKQVCNAAQKFAMPLFADFWQYFLRWSSEE